MKKLDSIDIFKFEKKKVGEMTPSEFVKYYNEWIVFVGRVTEYSMALDTMCKLIGLKRSNEK